RQNDPGQGCNCGPGAAALPPIRGHDREAKGERRRGHAMVRLDQGRHFREGRRFHLSSSLSLARSTACRPVLCFVMPSNLECLREYSLVVADSGDIEAVARWKPQDATTNPSLLLASAEDPRFRHLIDRDIDRVFVNFGCEILKHIP